VYRLRGTARQRQCPLAVFARPFGKKHVAIVQVADQGSDDTGRPGRWRFACW